MCVITKYTFFLPQNASGGCILPVTDGEFSGQRRGKEKRESGGNGG